MYVWKYTYLYTFGIHMLHAHLSIGKKLYVDYLSSALAPIPIN